MGVRYGTIGGQPAGATTQVAIVRSAPSGRPGRDAQGSADAALVRRPARLVVDEVLVAKEAWLAAAKQAGRPIPQPPYRPALYAH